LSFCIGIWLGISLVPLHIAHEPRWLGIDPGLHEGGRLKCKNTSGVDNYFDAGFRISTDPLGLLTYCKCTKSRQLDRLASHNAMRDFR